MHRLNKQAFKEGGIDIYLTNYTFGMKRTYLL